MNTSVTSRDAILSVSRQFITQNGFGSVNMRAIAAACGVSVGSVYNYFLQRRFDLCRCRKRVARHLPSVWAIQPVFQLYRLRQMVV